MKHGRLHRLLAAALALALLASHAVMPLPSGGVRTAEAAFLGPNAILGFFRIGAALGARNHVYREAGATAAEINAYYGGLIARAQGARREYVAQAAAGERPARFAAAYTRVEAALEAERRAAIGMIEAEKNQARREFGRKVGKEITNILIASPGGQRIMGKVRDAIKGARDAARAVQAAANEGRPIEALGNALAKQVGDIPIAQEAARALGSAVGHGIDRALGGAIGKVEKAIDNVQGAMGEAIDELDRLDARVAAVDGQARRPASVVEDSTRAGRISPVDRANAALDAAAAAYAGASALTGALAPGRTRSDMRDRIRGALLDERLTRIRDLVSGQDAGQSYCMVVDRAAYEAAAVGLGQAPKIALDPERAAYLVCYDIQTRDPRSATMLGAAEEAADAAPPAPAAPAAGAASEVDVCTLLPVDDGMVTDRYADSCVASIDALVGCNGCRSSIDITRTDSEEIARRFAGDVRCGNPNFYARGESPLGDAGGTCTETAGEPYREGVAQSYYLISFSYGRYLVTIHSTYPGQQELVLALGQEVIDRIAALPAGSPGK